MASLGVAAAAGAVVLSGADSARGQSAAIGELGAGGTAQGDISRQAAEEDRIGIDLVEGSTLAAKFAGTFSAHVDLLAPNDATTTVDLGATPTLTAWPVTETGRYHFRIRSADGSQGAYSLTAVATWPKKVALAGATGDAFSVGLPAGASVKGTVASSPAGAWNPSVSAFLAPDGANLLAAAIAAKKGVARLPKTAIVTSGRHAIAVDGGTPGCLFQATLSVKAPKRKLAKIDIRNGLSPVSFALDGIAKLMTDNGCVKCHPWASSAADARLHAPIAVVRMKLGQMPVGGPRVPAAAIALFQQWITTGMNP
jgi:hypothetical protein